MAELISSFVQAVISIVLAGYAFERKLIGFYRIEDVMGIRVSLNREDEMVKSIPIDCM